MSDRFRNPYHFVPLAQGGAPETLALEQVRSGPDGARGGTASPHVTHDRFVEKTHSGRIVCRLTVETPMLCGGEQEQTQHWTKKIKPFSLDGGKTPAIPGSTLRGMLSAVAEAVSSSAMRVLPDRTMSYRRQRNDALTPIGMVGVPDQEGSDGAAPTLWSFLPPDTAPLNPLRNTITLAEQLFGVVESRKKGEKHDTPAFALASRLRVSHARLIEEDGKEPWVESSALWNEQQKRVVTQEKVPDVPLKNLSNPKPPSPTMYFTSRRKPGDYIAKAGLRHSEHIVQGRKFYLRRKTGGSYEPASSAFVHAAALGNEREREQARKQSQSVDRLVEAGSAFWFTLDFDNLSSLELQLLAYALDPSREFRHQLGHGKPLGLGKVKVEVCALLEVERAARYRLDSLGAGRWHRAWVGNSVPPGLAREELPEKCDDLARKFNDLRKDFEDWASNEGLQPLLRAMELVGTPPADDHPVHYPQIENVQLGDANFDSRHFAWFVRNDDRSHGRNPGQYLAPLCDESGRVAESLPLLFRAQKQSPPITSYQQVDPASRPWRMSPPPADSRGAAGTAPTGGRPGAGPAVGGSDAAPIDPTSLRTTIVRAKFVRADAREAKLIFELLTDRPIKGGRRAYVVGMPRHERDRLVRDLNAGMVRNVRVVHFAAGWFQVELLSD